MAVLFDTTKLEAHERSDSWAVAHERIFFPIGVRFASTTASRGKIAAQPLGPLRAYRVSSDPSVVRRTSAAIRAEDPEQFLIATPLRGRTAIEQAGRSSVFGSGDISTWDSSRPFRVLHTEPFDLLLLVIPRTLLGARADAMYDRTAGRVSERSEIGGLATTFFRQVWRTLDSQAQAHAPAPAQEDLADGILALVRALHARDAPATPAARHLPSATLLSEIKSYIDQHLHDRRLRPDSIARTHSISKRYLHLLFARDGVTVSGWIRHRRLEACRRDLRDPALAHASISAIARHWALANPAHFSRSFRDTYGCTPSEFRYAAIGELSLIHWHRRSPDRDPDG